MYFGVVNTDLFEGVKMKISTVNKSWCQRSLLTNVVHFLLYKVEILLRRKVRRRALLVLAE